MKMKIAAFVSIFHTFAEEIVPGDLSVTDAVKKGFRLTFSSNFENKTGRENLIYLQNGNIVNKEKLNSKLSYCEMTSNAMLNIGVAQFIKGQEILATSSESSSGGFSIGSFGFGSSNIAINFLGVVQDAKKAGVSGEARIKIAELTPGSLRVEFNCKSNKSKAISIKDFKEIIGNSILDISQPLGETDIYYLVRTSQGVKRAIEEEKLKKEQAIQLKKQKREEDIKNLGAEALPSISLNKLTPGSSILFGTNIEVINPDLAKNLGFVFSDGRNVGAFNRDRVFIKKDIEFDEAKPNCQFYYLRYNSRSLAEKLKFEPGIYEIKKVKFFNTLKLAHIEAEFKNESENESIISTSLTCSNVLKLEDITSAFGINDTKIFLKEEKLIEQDNLSVKNDQAQDLNSPSEKETTLK